MKSQQNSREGESTYILFQERTLDWLCWTIKRQDKADNEVE